MTDLITDVHRSLADCIFCTSAQIGLGRADLLQLLGRLSEENSLGADGAMTDVAVVLTMAALYAIDVRILEQEDADGMSNIFTVYNYCWFPSSAVTSDKPVFQQITSLDGCGWFITDATPFLSPDTIRAVKEAKILCMLV